MVREYHADLDAEALGYNVHVFAFVGLTSQAEVDLQAFEEMVAEWSQVRECHMLMGETDFLLKIVAHDWDDFQKFLTSKRLGQKCQPYQKRHYRSGRLKLGRCASRCRTD